MAKIYHLGQYYSEDEIKSIVQNYYKSVYANKRDRHNRFHELFPSDLDKDSKILDYGCGMGGVTKLFHDKYGCEVDGIELSENELTKAKVTFGDIAGINFKLTQDFEFPEANYDLVFSSQVIEHVHNPGIYLSGINKMLKADGYLLISLPNIVNLNYLTNLMFFNKARARKRSRGILEKYNKGQDHINGWDPLHFITLCASCGYELVDLKHIEGTPVSQFLRRTPLIGKYIYILPFSSRLSYTMYFLFKKERFVEIAEKD